MAKDSLLFALSFVLDSMQITAWSILAYQSISIAEAFKAVLVEMRYYNTNR
jgi:hypothetical protein